MSIQKMNIMRIPFSLVLGLLLLTSCSGPDLQAELTQVKADLQQTQTALSDAQKALAEVQQEDSGTITHLVFFKLKSQDLVPDCIQAIKKVDDIPEVKDLEVGPFKDLGDPRAMSEFGVVMEMSFDSEQDYRIYQAHPIHLALKEAVKPILAGPPVTYDYQRN